MKKQSPKQPASETANPSPSEPVGNGTGAAVVSGVERLRRVCEILQCNFSVALNCCDNYILERVDIAEGICEIINCEVSFSDCEIDLELRRIAPLAISERSEKINSSFGVHREPPEITKSDIEEFIKDFSAERTSLLLVRLFGDLADTEIKYIDDQREIRARKSAFIVEWNTREFRRTFGEWLYFSRTETIADLAGELRRECSAKTWENDRQTVIDNFVTVSRLREIAFIAKSESRRAYLRKRQAANGCEPVTVPAADRKPDTGAADRDTAAARELLHGKPDTAQGTANPSGVAGVMNLYGDMIINTAKPIQVNAPAPVPKTGRNVGGVSQAIMAGFMGRSLSIIKKWETHPEKHRPPIVDGVTYSAGIRANGAGAFMYAQRYKATQRGALKTIGGDKGAGIAEKQAAQKWATEHAAELRAEGANLSEWE